MALPSLPKQHVTNQEFATATRSRAGADVFQNVGVCKHFAKDKTTGHITPCHCACDARGDYARLCRLGGWVVKRHNGIRDELAKEIEAVSAFPVHVEQHDESVPEDDRHPDIDFYDVNGRRRWIDVSVVTPWAGTWPTSQQVLRPGALAAAMRAEVLQALEL